jgi:NAD(P) transhydrogenase subunit alpha
MASLGFYSFAEPPEDEYIVEGEEEKRRKTRRGRRRGLVQREAREDQKLIRERIQEMDIVITTALVPGAEAPKLVDKDMVESMKPGSVIVDLAAESGGNLRAHGGRGDRRAREREDSGTAERAQPVAHPRQPALLAQHVQPHRPHHRGRERGRRGLDEKDPQLELDFEDEITDAMCIAHDGEIRHDDIREALESASEESEAR